MHILDFPLVRAADIGDEYESLLEERQHADLFWKNSHACTERRKSHCCKPTSETNLKENSGQAEYDQLLLVQRLWGIQQSRKAANIKKKKKGNTLLYSTAFPSWQWALRATWRHKMSHAALERNSTFMQMQLPGVTEAWNKTQQGPDRSQEKSFPIHGLLHNHLQHGQAACLWSSTWAGLPWYSKSMTTAPFRCNGALRDLKNVLNYKYPRLPPHSQQHAYTITWRMGTSKRNRKSTEEKKKPAKLEPSPQFIQVQTKIHCKPW